MYTKQGKVKQSKLK